MSYSAGDIISLRKDELVRIKLTYSVSDLIFYNYVASVNFRTGRCRFKFQAESRFHYRTLTRRRLNLILRKMESSGIFGRELQPILIVDDTWIGLKLFYEDGSTSEVDYFCSCDVDWKFVDLIEKYLEIGETRLEIDGQLIP